MKRYVIFGLLMMFVATACSGDQTATDPTEAAQTVQSRDADMEAPGGAVGSDNLGTGGEAANLSLPLDTRKVISRATISIEAEATRTAYDEIQTLIVDLGGFVESASIGDSQTDEGQPRIDLVLRLPADDLTETLDRIGAMGTKIVSQTQSGDDVTEEYVDLKARIENLTLLETELRELLADVRQQDEVDPAKLLQVYNEISRVRGEIEQLEGRKQVLDDLTSLATLQVAIAPTPETTPVVAEGWAPVAVAKQALQDLVTAVQGFGDVGIRFVILVLPMLIVFLGIPGYLAWRYRKRWMPRRDVPTA